jgi:hypothetical protein
MNRTPRLQIGCTSMREIGCRNSVDKHSIAKPPKKVCTAENGRDRLGCRRRGMAMAETKCRLGARNSYRRPLHVPLHETWRCMVGAQWMLGFL